MKTNVFCIIYATDGKPYLTYPEVDDETKNNPAAYPSDSILDKCVLFTNLNQETLKLLDQALDDIQGALLHDQRPELSIINMQQLIRKRMNQTEELASKELIVLQQLQLIFSILQQLSGLKQNLSHERDDQSTELASI